MTEYRIFEFDEDNQSSPIIECKDDQVAIEIGQKAAGRQRAGSWNLNKQVARLLLS